MLKLPLRFFFIASLFEILTSKVEGVHYAFQGQDRQKKKQAAEA